MATASSRSALASEDSRAAGARSGLRDGSLVGHRVGKAERGDEHLRIGRLRFGRRPVGREGGARLGGRLGVLGPPQGVIAGHARINPHGTDLPDAALLHIGVLEHAQRPEGPLVVHAGHAEIEAARPGGQAIRRHGDDGANLGVVVELACLQARRAEAIQAPADAGAADIGAFLAELHDAIVREQLGDVVPHLAVDVEAIGVLQVLDQRLVVQSRDADGKFCQRGRRRPTDGGRDTFQRRNRHARAPRIVVEGHDFGPIRRVAPTAVIGTGEAGIIGLDRDLPDAVLAHIVVLVDAARPFGAAAEIAEHRDLVPAALRMEAVCRQVHDRRHHQGAVEPSRRQAVARAAAQCAEDSLSPGRVRAPAFDGAALREEVRGLRPQAELAIVGIGVLEAFDRANGLGPFNPGLQRRHAGGRGWRRACGRGAKRSGQRAGDDRSRPAEEPTPVDGARRAVIVHERPAPLDGPAQARVNPTLAIFQAPSAFTYSAVITWRSVRRTKPWPCAWAI